jgi:hypothetical protein
MHLLLEFLKPTNCSFHGIVPRSTNYLFGRIALDVYFGNRSNFRQEKLEFKVMDWPSQYHVILGRPTFSRFMVVPHYTYLILKMLGPSGIITMKGSFELSNICDKEFHKMAQTFGTITKYGGPKEGTECNTSSITSRPSTEKANSNTADAKKLWVHTEDPNNSTPNKSGTPTS